MKTIIIISDIGSESKSIIPYGLKLGTYNECEVEITHTIDPRVSKGVSSPYANSQSITPGSTMSHEEILQREKDHTQKALDNLLSGEASRLNYPLKINTNIKHESPEKELKSLCSKFPGSIFIANLDPGNGMIQHLSEIMNIVGKTESPLLIVPSGFAFREPTEIYLLTDFSEHSYDPVKRAIKWFDKFPLVIKSFGIDKFKDASVAENKREFWEISVKSMLIQQHKIHSRAFIENLTKENIAEQIKQSTTGLVMLPKWLFTKQSLKLKKNAERTSFLSELKMPVLLY